MNEWIEIRELEVEGKIGVLEEERKNRQKVLVSLRFQIETAFAEVGDQLEKTIDYSAAAAEVEKVVESSGAHLIEKLILEIGDALMARFPMRYLELELRKFVLPNARFVSVKSNWQRTGESPTESSRPTEKIQPGDHKWLTRPAKSRW
jgi:7,8-dihydroneopterin aldolase/epimerase/oxygenase